jgi:hypothetical protein
MPYSFICWIVVLVLLVVYFCVNNGKLVVSLGLTMLLIALSSIPVILCIDLPNRDRRNAIPPDTCIECKIRIEDKFYAIGCDGHQYTINMSAWALLNTSECE